MIFRQGRKAESCAIQYAVSGCRHPGESAGIVMEGSDALTLCCCKLVYYVF